MGIITVMSHTEHSISPPRRITFTLRGSAETIVLDADRLFIHRYEDGRTVVELSGVEMPDRRLGLSEEQVRRLLDSEPRAAA